MATITCKKCKKETSLKRFVKDLHVCHHCGFHDYISAKERLAITVDEDSFKEMATDINSVDFLKFYDVKSYGTRLEEAKLKSSLDEAIVVGNAAIKNYSIAIGVMDFSYMGGSMGSAVGEKVKRLVDYSIESRVPLIIFAASGGARMQEGIMSLMQMAKTVSSIHRIREAKIPYFCVITNPTTGGVSASFATVADIIISEPDALFCFAGPRVVQQTIKKKIPEDFGLPTRNLKNGQIDMIISRKEIRTILGRLLSLFIKVA
jgi:acetyl-CoA carboxylase carboxyl transferase subunit beta